MVVIIFWLKLASVFGETKRGKSEREREQRVAARKVKEKAERGSLVMKKRSIFERGEGGEKRRLECFKEHISHK